MIVDTANPNQIKYVYRRGGVQLIATINVASQQITWEAFGLDFTANAGAAPTGPDANRAQALEQGLKLATGTLAKATAAGWT